MRPFRRKKPSTVQDRDSVFVEVLQNGELLSRTERSFHKRGTVFLTPDPNGELTAPFYPLPSKVRILKITNRGVELDLDPNWEGFTTCEGKVENIDSDRKSAYTHIMKRGDYGSIAYNDLRVLIRIGRPHRQQAQNAITSSEYRGSFLEFWLGRKDDLSGLFWGLGIASIFCFASVYGLLKRPDDRPRQFIELRDEYTLPFIHPLHLSQGPETLQSSYARKQPIKSAVDFAQNFADIVMGFEAKSSARSPLLASASAAHQDLFTREHEAIVKLKDEHRTQEAKIRHDRRNGLVAIPVIYGESMSGSLVRMQEKLRKWYAGTPEMLALRRKTTAAFKADKGYDFKEYRNPEIASKKPAADPGPSPDEEALYASATALAEKSAAHRAEIVKHRRPTTILEAGTAPLIGLRMDAPVTSQVQDGSFQPFSMRLSFISASIFDPEKPKIVREPVIGDIDRNAVDQTIAKSRFELQLCYELALRRNQDARGSMQWRWQLDTKGQISELELVETTVHDQKMAACMREKISRWKWPRPRKGSVEITYPFYFNASKG